MPRKKVVPAGKHLSKVENEIKSRFSLKEKEHLLCAVLKDICIGKKVDESKVTSEIALSRLHGRSLRISLNPAAQTSVQKATQVSAEGVMRIANNIDLSVRKTHSVAAAVRI